MNLSWDERWQQKKQEPVPTPDSWLIEQKAFLSGGTALDLACGRGRNSLFLAENGYEVLGIDVSPTALNLLRSTAEIKHLKIDVLEYDLDSGLPPHPEKVDLILSFYFLQRTLFSMIKKKLAPGGLFIGRSFCHLEAVDKLDPIIYNPGELAELFTGWEILAYEEGVESSPRGGTLAGIVVRKPPE
jgi:SAM-dependent methyltransferase